MKKEKLTPEEKKENRLINKQWNEFIRRMESKGALINDQNTTSYERDNTKAILREQNQARIHPI